MSRTVVRKDVMVHPALDGDQVRCTVVLGNYYDSDADGELLSALKDWPGENEVIIESDFLLPCVLQELIWSYQLYGIDGNPINVEGKPIFDALRKDLVAMLARLDGLEFKSASEWPTLAVRQDRCMTATKIDRQEELAGLAKAANIIRAEISRAESLLGVEDRGTPVFNREQTEAGVCALREVLSQIEAGEAVMATPDQIR